MSRYYSEIRVAPQRLVDVGSDRPYGFDESVEHTVRSVKVLTDVAEGHVQALLAAGVVYRSEVLPHASVRAGCVVSAHDDRVTTRRTGGYEFRRAAMNILAGRPQLS